jgi:alkanesulfonate monooxygenase SsuD/methylene tetrahydromethanopterin reductase-like flavin-dependent oxidoreductase (luciferase family)
LEQYCQSIGRKPSEIKSSWGGEIFITGNHGKVAGMAEKFKPRNITVDQYVKCNIVGTPDECIKKLMRFVEAGCTYFMLYFPDATDGPGLQLFAEHVMTKFGME